MKKLANIVKEELSKVFNEELYQEERISNKDASEEVANRKNFVGSHTYGEDLGDLEQMYAAYSYGEQHPLYVWDGVRWYHNNEDYILPDGRPNKWTKKHLESLRPNSETQGRPTSFLVKIIKAFKDKHNIGTNSHTDLAPGEK
jgi:hypothetical protein